MQTARENAGARRKPRLRLLRIAATSALAVFAGRAEAQLSLNTTTAPVVVTFDATLSGVGNGAFGGTGFQATPTTGQLDSDAWAATGWSNGTLAFGGTQTTASTDYTRGAVTTAQTTGGFYAFSGGNITTGRALGIQPGGSDFAPGTLTLRLQNTTGTTINALRLSYLVYVRNDQLRSNSFNFSVSANDSAYTALTGLDLTSAEASDALGFVRNERGAVVTGLSIANNAFYYLRWNSADVGGSGSRDEFALDNISASTTAAPLTWDSNTTTVGTQDGPGTWSATGTNWIDNVNFAWNSAANNNALFGAGGGAGPHAVSVSGTVAAGSITFATGTPTYTLSGGTIQLTSGITANKSATINSTVTLGASQTWTVASGATLGVGGAIGGSSMALTKAGLGTLTLSVANGYSGNTTVSAGTLTLSNSGSISSSPVVSVASGATLNVAAVTGGFDVAANQTLTGAGNVIGGIDVGPSATIAPGTAGIGTLTTDAQEWKAGGTYEWEIGNVNGATGTGWDFIQMGADALTLNDDLTSATPFTLKVVRRNAAIGATIDPGAWFTIAHFDTFDVAGFDPDDFVLPDPDASGQTWEVDVEDLSGSGGGYNLRVSTTPEPAAAAALFAAGVVALSRRRQRR